MNGNSSKQVLLSVLGIAILVVAVVGVSFAFFSYTKVGSTNNVISTGEIYTYLTTGDTMTLTNAMPVQTTPTSVINATTGDVGALTFTVTGKNDSDTAITYKIYLVSSDAAAPTGKSALISDADIGVLMSSSGTGAATAISTATDVNTLGGLTSGALLGTGTFAAGSAETTHSYTVNLWVKGDTVKISDTDASVNGVTTRYCAHAKVGSPETPDTTTGNYGCELNLPVWSTLYYQAKVKVVANTNASGSNMGA